MVKMVVIEAISVNAGSALTPVGNPQNIFLWQLSGVSFLYFVWAMLPVFFVLFSVLLAMILLTFRQEPLVMREDRRGNSYDSRLFSASALLLFLFVLSIELGLALYFLPLVVAAYLVLDPPALKRTDWLLITLFMVMFIDFRIISDIPPLSGFITPSAPASTFFDGVLASQLMSNVPATIFLSNLGGNWRMLAWGVNVGGSGLATGSLASIIAIRLFGERSIWLEFHRYSVPYLILTASIVFVLLYYCAGV